MRMESNNGNIRFLSAVSYIGVLFVIGHFAVEKDNPDLRFHKYQGGVLFCSFFLLYMADLAVSIALSFLPVLQIIVALLITIALVAVNVMLTVQGVLAALQFRQRMLPFIGIASVRLRAAVDRSRQE